jgi:F-type H+-transporting ATPase subunit b
MQELIEKLGLNWKLLLAQVVNFLIVLTVLRLTVYKPFVRMLHERRNRIEKGMQDAEEAGKRLSEAGLVKQEKLAEAEQESMVLMQESEKRAKEKEAAMLVEAKEKEVEIVKAAEKVGEARKIEAEQKFYAEAAGIVRQAVAKTAELSPSAIDEALVRQALDAVRKIS